MKSFWFTLILAGCSFAAVTGIQVTGTTATQAVVTYTAPNTAPCSLTVSEIIDGAGNPQAPFIHDADATLFPGADQDTRPSNTANGNTRALVIGKHSAEKAADGRYYSRALQTNTAYYGKIACGADTALFNSSCGFSRPWRNSSASLPARESKPAYWQLRSGGSTADGNRKCSAGIESGSSAKREPACGRSPGF